MWLVVVRVNAVKVVGVSDVPKKVLLRGFSSLWGFVKEGKKGCKETHRLAVLVCTVLSACYRSQL